MKSNVVGWNSEPCLHHVSFWRGIEGIIFRWRPWVVYRIVLGHSFFGSMVCCFEGDDTWKGVWDDTSLLEGLLVIKPSRGLWFHGLLQLFFFGWAIFKANSHLKPCCFISFMWFLHGIIFNRNTCQHHATGRQGKVILCNGGILSSLDSASLLAESRPDSRLRWTSFERFLGWFSKPKLRCKKLRCLGFPCLKICIEDVSLLVGTNLLLTRDLRCF